MGTEMLIMVVMQKIDDTKWYTVDEKYTNKFSMRQNEVKKKRTISAPRLMKALSNQPHKVEPSENRRGHRICIEPVPLL